MASPSALRRWCRAACADYPDVHISNLSSSFRDGLAFCAVIHRHRPELIDFSSLCKDDVYQNNKLAFEVAEQKLGIPALLDPTDMVSCEVPDCLSVTTYLSQYYYVFNSKSCAGPAGLRSSYFSLLKHFSRSTSLESSTHSGTSTEKPPSARPRTVCKLCSKPVHLIQRCVVDGDVYHRSCFRCTVCRRTLLPGFYMQGDTGSLVCAHHVPDSTAAAADAQPRCEPAGYCSLNGLVISSVPQYSKKTELQDKLVREAAKMEGKARQRSSRGVKTPPPPRPPPPEEQSGPAPVVSESKSAQKVTETQQPSSPRVRATGGSGRPVPAPRRTLDVSAAPVPAPRVKASQTTSSSSAADCASSRSPPTSAHITSPAGGSPKVKASHPWMGIVHPGPWTQLPPAPPPLHTPRSKSVSNLQGPWDRPTVLAPNPFGEEEEEETWKEASKPQTGSSAFKSNCGVRPLDKRNPPKRPEATSADTAETTGSAALGEGGREADSPAAEEAHSHFLPRSVSVPADASTHALCSSAPDGPTEENEPVASRQSEQTCKSKTFQSPPCRRAPAPGHGFPLIKRKVQTDPSVSAGDPQVEMRELNEQLEVLEQRGAELEINLRHCRNDKQEEKMLTEWFCLVHERQVLLCRDAELVYLTQQQMLEGRQADVEFGLRCLLNKPDSDWSREDQHREQQLTNELVAIIEQRDQIIGCLDRDRQREREEDVLWETMMKNKGLQREGLKEPKKSRGKLKPTKVFKMLSHKAGSLKDTVDKKS